MSRGRLSKNIGVLILAVAMAVSSAGVATSGEGNDRLDVSSAVALSARLKVGEGAQGRFVLVQPATVAEIAAVLEGLDVERVELISKDNVEGRIYTSGYIFEGTAVSAEAYVDGMSATFADMASEIKLSAMTVVNRETDPRATADAMQMIALAIRAEDARITALLVTGSDASLTQLDSSPIVAESTVDIQSSGASTLPSTDTRVGDAVVLDAGSGGNCSNAWWPYTGRISTQYSGIVPHRYVWQSFKWSQWRIDNLYDCDGVNTSYEHEAWFNNYDGSLFLSSTVKSWSSNLPDGYLDTGFLDGNGEMTMTIGTGAAYQLDANVTYTTYIRTTPGNATSDSGKVNGQRGLNLCPIGLTGGWCVFARATEKLLPAWNHSAPGSTDWTHS